MRLIYTSSEENVSHIETNVGTNTQNNLRRSSFNVIKNAQLVRWYVDTMAPNVLFLFCQLLTHEVHFGGHVNYNDRRGRDIGVLLNKHLQFRNGIMQFNTLFQFNKFEAIRFEIMEDIFKTLQRSKLLKCVDYFCGNGQKRSWSVQLLLIKANSTFNKRSLEDQFYHH